MDIAFILVVTFCVLFASCVSVVVIDELYARSKQRELRRLTPPKPEIPQIPVKGSNLAPPFTEYQREHIRRAIVRVRIPEEFVLITNQSDIQGFLNEFLELAGSYGSKSFTSTWGDTFTAAPVLIYDFPVDISNALALTNAMNELNQRHKTYATVSVISYAGNLGLDEVTT